MRSTAVGRARAARNAGHAAMIGASRITPPVTNISTDQKMVGKVFVTGLGLPSEMAGHAAHGFAAVLPKPYSAEDARAAIGPLLPLA